MSCRDFPLYCRQQGLINYGLFTEFSSSPVFVSKVLLEPSFAHLSRNCLWLLLCDITVQQRLGGLYLKVEKESKSKISRRKEIIKPKVKIDEIKRGENREHQENQRLILETY